MLDVIACLKKIRSSPNLFKRESSMSFKLPIALASDYDEAAFSLLARNTHANASQTTADFCTTLGLNKSKLCQGEDEQVDLLAAITGSDPRALRTSTAQRLDTKTASINGQNFLNRSIRKAELSICPLCWLDAAQNSNRHLHENGVRSIWLPKQFHTCHVHKIALIPLPYQDYTTCYDPVARAQHEPGWLRTLEARIVQQCPTRFEIAAKCQLKTRVPMVEWLPDIQIDVMEKWCLGLGTLIRRGLGNPQLFDHAQQRKLIDIGFEVTAAGLSRIHTEVDRALGRHQTKLSRTWVYGWALQSASPSERKVFRAMCQDMAQQQGYYCLHSVSDNASASVGLSAALADISRKSNRSKRWVKRALIADGLLPATGMPTVRDFRAHVRRCNSHINELNATKGCRECAATLGVGTAMFEGIVRYGFVKPFRTRAFKKPRYKASEIERVFENILSSILKVPAPSKDLRSLSEVCFVTRCDAAEIIEFILKGALPATQLSAQDIGLGALLVSFPEVQRALKKKQRARLERQNYLSIEAVMKILGLERFQVRRLIAADLLQSRTLAQCRDFSGGEHVRRRTLKRFMLQYETAKTAASKFEIPYAKVSKSIKMHGVSSVSDELNVPVFDKDEISKILKELAAL